MTTPFTLDTRAATGFSNAAAYDLNRPSYPPEAVDKLLTHLGVAGAQNAKIVDLACGTGKFTELLAARLEQFDIIGVEPHAGMREVLVKKGLGDKVRVEDGDAGNMPIEEDWGDAVIAAQKMKDIIATLGDGHARFRDMKWKEVFEQQQDTTPLQALKDTFTHNFPYFSLPLGEESVKWIVWLSGENIWARFSTLSQIANLTEERRECFHQEVLAALKEHGERNEKGEVALHGITFLAWTSRI
ncbi:hypothetical protein ACEPPN_011701 [Leptodophora sp. 'Broadleaf-Isolate-01']